MPEKLKLDKESLRNGLIASFTKKACEQTFEIYLLICAYSEDDHFAQVSIQTLRQKTGYSQYHICKCLNALEKGKYIRRLRKGQGGKPQFYEIIK